MSKVTKIWLVTAAFLVVAGLIMFTAALAVNGWDFSKLSTVKYETNTFEIGEEFSSISINTDTSDILFVPSEDDICRVVCYEQESMKHSVDVKEGTLTVKSVDDREWYEFIGINFGTPKITVYLPTDEYSSLFIRESTGDIEIPKGLKFEDVDICLSTGDVEMLASVTGTLKINTSTGDIRVENAYAGTLELCASTGDVTVFHVTCVGDISINVSTGDVKMSDIKCQSVSTNGSTGDIIFKNVIAKERLSAKRSTGDVRLTGADAAEILIETDTGDVAGTVLSEKVFVTKTSTGDVDVPKTATGGRCEITTSTGDIEIEIE